ncbi:hypothetical protein [Streptomyces luteogriseus]|uniref:hypothetical protein n=1 Tax=Streptomyces luteogriseus TaxID=68233 RepID=UPI003817C8B6
MAEIQTEVDVPARMRDGTVLRAESTGPGRGLGVHRIRVNAANPGPHERGPDADREGDFPMAPLGRIGTLQEIAVAVPFLISDAAS